MHPRAVDATNESIKLEFTTDRHTVLLTVFIICCTHIDIRTLTHTYTHAHVYAHGRRYRRVFIITSFCDHVLLELIELYVHTHIHGYIHTYS